jgi:hypothetical protein
VVYAEPIRDETSAQSESGVPDCGANALSVLGMAYRINRTPNRTMPGQAGIKTTIPSVISTSGMLVADLSLSFGIIFLVTDVHCTQGSGRKYTVFKEVESQERLTMHVTSLIS